MPELAGHLDPKVVRHGPSEAEVPSMAADAGLSTRDEGEASGRRYRFLAKAIPPDRLDRHPGRPARLVQPEVGGVHRLSARDVPERAWRRTLHPEDRPRWLEGWEKARLRDGSLSIDLRLRRSDGIFRWHLAKAMPVLDRTGRPLKWLGTCTDIDDQKRAEGMLGFLAEVSTVLAGSLDYETTLAAVARMAVPHVADWCVVDMLEPDGTTRRLAVAHRDPAQVELGREIGRRYPPSLGDPRGPSHAIRTGQSVLAPEVDDEALVASARDPEHLAMLRAQGCKSSIAAALAARGRTLGVITFAMAESGRRYTSADLTLVEDLARRAGMAVDNARLYREARQAREEAEAASRAKDRFLAVLSHELRTPLTPVLAEVSAMLADPATPASIRPVLEMTRRNIDLEARLIDDLLDLSRIGQGKLRLDRSAVDAHALIGHAVNICREGIDTAGLSVTLDLAAVRHHVEADPARLQQMAWNLIKNAAKFTPAGGSIAIRTRDEGPDLVLEVADTGVGIDPAILPRIFEAFEQGGSAVTRRFGGLGLGLVISRSLAEAHGGRLVAASPGKGLGATFTLRLPVVAAPTVGTDPRLARARPSRSLRAAPDPPGRGRRR